MMRPLHIASLLLAATPIAHCAAQPLITFPDGPRNTLSFGCIPRLFESADFGAGISISSSLNITSAVFTCPDCVPDASLSFQSEFCARSCVCAFPGLMQTTTSCPNCPLTIEYRFESSATLRGAPAGAFMECMSGLSVAVSGVSSQGGLWSVGIHTAIWHVVDTAGQASEASSFVEVVPTTCDGRTVSFPAALARVELPEPPVAVLHTGNGCATPWPRTPSADAARSLPRPVTHIQATIPMPNDSFIGGMVIAWDNSSACTFVPPVPPPAILYTLGFGDAAYNGYPIPVTCSVVGNREDIAEDGGRVVSCFGYATVGEYQLILDGLQLRAEVDYMSSHFIFTSPDGVHNSLPLMYDSSTAAVHVQLLSGNLTSTAELVLVSDPSPCGTSDSWAALPVISVPSDTAPIEFSRHCLDGQQAPARIGTSGLDITEGGDIAVTYANLTCPACELLGVDLGIAHTVYNTSLGPVIWDAFCFHACGHPTCSWLDPTQHSPSSAVRALLEYGPSPRISLVPAYSESHSVGPPLPFYTAELLVACVKAINVSAVATAMLRRFPPAKPALELLVAVGPMFAPLMTSIAIPLRVTDAPCPPLQPSVCSPPQNLTTLNDAVEGARYQVIPAPETARTCPNSNLTSFVFTPPLSSPLAPVRESFFSAGSYLVSIFGPPLLHHFCPVRSMLVSAGAQYRVVGDTVVCDSAAEPFPFECSDSVYNGYMIVAPAVVERGVDYGRTLSAALSTWIRLESPAPVVPGLRTFYVSLHQVDDSGQEEFSLEMQPLLPLNIAPAPACSVQQRFTTQSVLELELAANDTAPLVPDKSTILFVPVFTAARVVDHTSDSRHSVLKRAVVRLASNSPFGDVLRLSPAFVAPEPLNVTYDDNTHVMVITGAAPARVYEAALLAVELGFVDTPPFLHPFRVLQTYVASADCAAPYVFTTLGPGPHFSTSSVGGPSMEALDRPTSHGAGAVTASSSAQRLSVADIAALIGGAAATLVMHLP